MSMFRIFLVYFAFRAYALRISLDHKPEKEKKECIPSDLYMPRQGDLEIPPYEIMMGAEGFNPALAVLPPQVAEQLHPEAVYVQANKLSNSQCNNVCEEENEFMKRSKGFVSSISILSKNMTRLLGPHVIPAGEDMRLLLLDDRILADYHYHGDHWELRELTLKMDKKTSKFEAKLSAIDLKPFSTSSVSPKYTAQNIAVIHHHDTLYGLWWSDGDTRVIQNNIAFSNGPTYGGPDHHKHNSGHPLYLPKLNKYLMATHISNAIGKHGFKWGSEYFQQFMLLDADPPFRATKRTKPFCFPSPHDKSKCEVVQYVGGWIQDPQDHTHLLISLGINDCKAAHVKVPLATILDHMEDASTSEASNMNLDKISSL